MLMAPTVPPVAEATARILGRRTEVPGLTPGERLHESATRPLIAAEDLSFDIQYGPATDAGVLVLRRALFDLMTAATFEPSLPIDVLWRRVTKVLNDLACGW